MANANPLNMLRAASLMRTPRNGEAVDRDRAVGPDTPMRGLVALARSRGGPFPAVDAGGTVLGVVGERELWDGLLRRRDGAG